MRSLLLQIIAIAAVTASELFREKILWMTVVFAVMLVALSFAVAELSIYEPWRIALDFGTAAIFISASLLAIVVGGVLISREVKDRTLYLILSKSVWRWQFVVGKMLGLHFVILINALAMNLVLLSIFMMSGGQFHINILYNFALQIAEFVMLATVACFFSTFSTAMLSSIFTAGLWLIGHAMDDVRIAIERMRTLWLKDIMGYLIKVFPDFTVFDIKPELSHGIPVVYSQVLFSILYAFIFVTFVAFFACTVFSKRDL
jgi:hypothetical protein